ncbi:gemini of cajal bodies-associated protein 8 domain-containing protein [Ditylenchus destructor]|nr:gemini of cajal bodies-associated protein 8 domain-containing protein [Ditylenchus destructor]
MEDLPKTFESSDFKVFWEHYAIAQKWIRDVEEARQATISAMEWKKAENDVISMLNLSHCDENVPGPSATVLQQDDIEMTQEMIDFYKISMEHRKEREKIRKIEEETKKRHRVEKGWLKDDKEEEYTLASEIGIQSQKVQALQPSSKQKAADDCKKRMTELYGNESNRMLAMESALDFKFDEEYKKNNPSMWPNIPLRF